MIAVPITALSDSGPVLAAAGSNLWEILALAVFFLAPLWRGVVEARKQARAQREKAERGTSASTRTAEPEAPADLDPWEALLRGDPEVVREAEPAPPAPVTTPAGSSGAPPRPSTPPELPETPKRRRPRRSFTPAEPSRSISALEELEPDLPHVEVHSTDGADQLGGELEERAMPTHDLRRAQRGHGRSTYSLARALGGGGRDWREAVVLAEVLGTPVALRRGAASDPRTALPH